MSTEPEVKTSDTTTSSSRESFFEIVSSSITNVLLTVIIIVLVYKFVIIRYWKGTKTPAPPLPKIRKDMTAAELRLFDGNQSDGRVLLAVNGWIFDVTKERRFYGPGGAYAAFGGKDATRGLATFELVSPAKEYDDLSDLTSMEMESVKEWEAQFREKYDLVGRLLKPGEEPINYSDEEPEETEKSTANEEEDKKDK